MTGIRWHIAGFRQCMNMALAAAPTVSRCVAAANESRRGTLIQKTTRPVGDTGRVLRIGAGMDGGRAPIEKRDLGDQKRSQTFT